MPMCHHTLTWFSSATSRIPAMFKASSMSIRTPIVTRAPVRTIESPIGEDRRRVAVVDAHVGEDRRHDRRVQEVRGGPVDPGHDRELADEVEPGRPPAPVLVLHPAGPVIQAAGGRISRGDLAHRCRDQEHEDRDQRPAEQDGRRTAPGQSVVVQDDRPGQDADDAEADGEVAEAAHRAEQLLRVAELVQVRDVLLDDVVAGCRLCHRFLPHSYLGRRGRRPERRLQPERGAARETRGCAG